MSASVQQVSDPRYPRTHPAALNCFLLRPSLRKPDHPGVVGSIDMFLMNIYTGLAFQSGSQAVCFFQALQAGFR